MPPIRDVGADGKEIETASTGSLDLETRAVHADVPPLPPVPAACVEKSNPKDGGESFLAGASLPPVIVSSSGNVGEEGKEIEKAVTMPSDASEGVAAGPAAPALCGPAQSAAALPSSDSGEHLEKMAEASERATQKDTILKAQITHVQAAEDLQPTFSKRPSMASTEDIEVALDNAIEDNGGPSLSLPKVPANGDEVPDCTMPDAGAAPAPSRRRPAVTKAKAAAKVKEQKPTAKEKAKAKAKQGTKKKD